MKLIKQSLFTIELLNPSVKYDDVFFVEADNFEEALFIAKETVKEHYEGWQIRSITVHSPCYKSITKTVTIDL